MGIVSPRSERPARPISRYLSAFMRCAVMKHNPSGLVRPFENRSSKLVSLYFIVDFGALPQLHLRPNRPHQLVFERTAMCPQIQCRTRRNIMAFMQLPVSALTAAVMSALLCSSALCQANAPFMLQELGHGAWAAIDNPAAKADQAGSNAGFVIGPEGAR